MMRKIIEARFAKSSPDAHAGETSTDEQQFHVVPERRSLDWRGVGIFFEVRK